MRKLLFLPLLALGMAIPVLHVGGGLILYSGGGYIGGTLVTSGIFYIIYKLFTSK